MIIYLEVLKKIVEEAEMRKHNELSFSTNGQVLSRKTNDGRSLRGNKECIVK